MANASRSSAPRTEPRRLRAGKVLGFAVANWLACAAHAQTGSCLLTDGYEDVAGDPLLRCTEVPPASIGMVGVTFNTAQGDIDVTLRRDDDGCIAGRLGDACTWSDRSFETGEEILSVLNWRGTSVLQRWRAAPAGVPETRFELAQAYVDAPVCTASYPADLCEGRVGGVPKLVQFPRHDPTDPFVADGFRLESPANYRWARLELVMLARDALRRTQLQFPGTRPLGIADIAQRDGITPGYDIGSPRHPPTAHDQGGTADFAYFNTLAAQGLAPFSAVRGICDANGGNNDGLYCNAGAASTHIVDLPRQVYFMAQLFGSARVRVIGVDRVIAPLLRAEADRQLQAQFITQPQRDAFYTRLAFGDGWQFHFTNMHVALRFWGT